MDSNRITQETDSRWGEIRGLLESGKGVDVREAVLRSERLDGRIRDMLMDRIWKWLCLALGRGVEPERGQTKLEAVLAAGSEAAFGILWDIYRRRGIEDGDIFAMWPYWSEAEIPELLKVVEDRKGED